MQDFSLVSDIFIVTLSSLEATSTQCEVLTILLLNNFYTNPKFVVDV